MVSDVISHFISRAILFYPPAGETNTFQNFVIAGFTVDKTSPIYIFVGDQMAICKAFGFEPPAGCDAEYVSRAVTEKKRGRPAKPKVETQTS